MKNKLLILIAMFILVSANAFGQAGGTYAITESVVAGGGGQNSAGGTFSVDGTVGQNSAGGVISNLPFAITSGFWNFSPFAPTAATVVISGRVKTHQGSGISNANVSITDMSGANRQARTATFGYFAFDNILVGETYIISVSSKRFTFSQPVIVRTFLDTANDIVFVADNSN
jgi:hypothetical protein